MNSLKCYFLNQNSAAGHNGNSYESWKIYWFTTVKGGSISWMLTLYFWGWNLNQSGGDRFKNKWSHTRPALKDKTFLLSSLRHTHKYYRAAVSALTRRQYLTPWEWEGISLSMVVSWKQLKRTARVNKKGKWKSFESKTMRVEVKNKRRPMRNSYWFQVILKLLKFQILGHLIKQSTCSWSCL